MKKTIIILIVLALIALFAYVFMIGGDVAEDSQLDETPSENVEDTEAAGTIVSVDTDQVAADGPAFVTVLQEDETEVVVAVPSMGINLCPAQENIADVFELEAGDEVEVRGRVDSGFEGAIVPCESADHYLRIVE
ncbi:MAG: hypothetical protein WDZ82_00320 [Candidatus Paceibacterota bacterium]